MKQYDIEQLTYDELIACYNEILHDKEHRDVTPYQRGKARILLLEEIEKRRKAAGYKPVK